MYIHLGSNVTVRSRDVVAVFDLDNTSSGKITREFLRSCENGGEVINVSEEDLPKSFVVCSVRGENKIYISPITSATILKRIEGV